MLREAWFGCLRDLGKVFSRMVRFHNFSNLARNVIEGIVEGTDANDSHLMESTASSKK